MFLTSPVRYCTLLNCGSFLHVHIVSLLVCNSCVAPTFSFECNNKLRELTLIYLIWTLEGFPRWAKHKYCVIYVADLPWTEENCSFVRRILLQSPLTLGHDSTVCAQKHTTKFFSRKLRLRKILYTYIYMYIYKILLCLYK